jgi:hypothetical protein
MTTVTRSGLNENSMTRESYSQVFPVLHRLFLRLPARSKVHQEVDDTATRGGL